MSTDTLQYLSYCKKRNNKIDIIKRLCATIFLRIMRAPTSALLQCTKGRSESLRPMLAGKPPHKRLKEIFVFCPLKVPFQRRSPCRESTGLRNTRSRGKRRKEGRPYRLVGERETFFRKSPLPQRYPSPFKAVHENQPVCPASGSASNSNNWPSVFLPNATCALLMMRQGTLMILYRSRSSGKWFTS